MRPFVAISHLLLPLLLACGCEASLNVSREPELVVEAWIEEGKNPVVIVTTSVTYDELPADEEALAGHIVRWAKVWMSDGSKTVNLTGVPTDKYFPPYVYTTSEMRGEAGRNYDLQVEYGNVTATASTTIPESVPIVDVMLKHERDSLYSAYVVLEKVEETAFCRFFVRLNDTFWVPSLFGNFVYSSAEDEPDKVLLRRGYDLDMRDYVSNFISGETVEVKLCTMTEPMYKYWQDFDNNLFYGRTPFFPAKSNPASNLLGAVGYFAGYGCSTARFVVP